MADTFTGTLIGYDPGGNDKHGLAVFHYQEGTLVSYEITTKATLHDVIQTVSNVSDLKGIGIDTLTCWSSGKSGFRPADAWLRKRYPDIQNSITSCNSLFGSMPVNGMALLLEISNSNISISETHPKVVYYALSQQKYDYVNKKQLMDKWLSQLFHISFDIQNDHEWDAVISVYCILMGLTKSWTLDLHTLPTRSNEQLITPVGQTNYWWTNG